MSVSDYILAVDDEPNIRQLISLVLQREGFAVKTAANGTECLTLAAQQTPAVVLLDLQMPGMQGGEVLYRLRSRPGTEDVPVIIVSGSTQLSHLAHLHQVDGFLEKPFDLEQLVAVIHRLVSAGSCTAGGSGPAGFREGRELH